MALVGSAGLVVAGAIKPVASIAAAGEAPIPAAINTDADQIGPWGIFTLEFQIDGSVAR